LYLSDPEGLSRVSRRRMLDTLRALEEKNHARVLDPEIDARIAQYEMAYRMQTAVPSAMDLSDEPAHIVDMYGPEARTPGTYAANCLLARRRRSGTCASSALSSGLGSARQPANGYHHDGEVGGSAVGGARDGPEAARAAGGHAGGGGGEFGRTNYSQGKLTKDNYGRDHHPRCFTVWMAGGGVKRGSSTARPTSSAYNIVRDRCTSTTSRPRCCILLVSITRSSCSSTRASLPAAPTCTARRARTCWRDRSRAFRRRSTAPRALSDCAAAAGGVAAFIEGRLAWFDSQGETSYRWSRLVLALGAATAVASASTDGCCGNGGGYAGEAPVAQDAGYFRGRGGDAGVGCGLSAGTQSRRPRVPSACHGRGLDLPAGHLGATLTHGEAF
jgi:hypothetical protein